MKKFSITLSLILFLGFLFGFTVESKEVPRLTGPVVDQSQALAKSQKKKLSKALKTYSQNTGNQLQVLITDSLEGEALEKYTIKVVEDWQIGGEKEDKGLLFLIALKDRRMRIEVGRGLEGKVTDLQSGRLVKSAAPFFRKKQYYEGIAHVMSSLAEKIGDGPLPLEGKKVKADKTTAPSRAEKPQMNFIAALLFFLFLFFSGRGLFRRRYYVGGVRHRGVGGGFSGLSGGGWSGGGGSFAGGGASGSW